VSPLRGIATEVDRAHLDTILRTLCEDPRIDDEVKFDLPSGKERYLTAYADARYVIIFHHLNNWTLSVLNIGYAGEFRDESDLPTVGPIL